MYDPTIRGALRISLFYALLASTWIVLSDYALCNLISDLDILTQLQTYKDWLFIAITSVLLFVVLRLEQRARRQAETRYRQLFNTSADALFVLDSQGRIVDANQTAVARYGYTHEELLRLTVLDLAAPDLREQAPARIRQALAEGAQFEWRHQCKDGNELPVEIAACPIILDGKQCILSSVRDISERKLAESELRKSEARFRALFMSMSEGFYLSEVVYDDSGNPCDYKYLEVNPKFEHIVGLSRGQIIGKRYKELVPVDTTQWLDNYCQVARTGEPNTYEFYSPEYQKHFITYSYQPEKGQVSVFVLDITERKRAEETVNSAKTFLDMVIDMSPFSMWISDKEGTLIRTNRSLRETINLTDDNIIGKYNVLKDTNLKIQDVMPLVRAVFEKHEPARFSIPWKAMDAGDVDFRGGRDMYIDVSMFPILDAQNELTNVVCQWIDITERKRAEEALRESQARLEEAQRIAHVGSWEWIAETDTATWSKELCDILEVDPEKPVPSMAEQDTLYTPESMMRMRTSAEKTMRTGDPYEIELERVREDDSRRWLLARGERWLDKKGQLIGLRGTALDITERKLRQQEYKDLINGMNDTAFVIDFEGKFVEVNDPAVRILKYTREELLTMGPPDIDPHLSKDDIGQLIEGMKKGQQQVFETRHRTKIGEIIPVEISSSLVTYLGQAAILSIARDITRRRWAEEALRQHAERLKTLHEIDQAILAARSPEDIAQAALSRIWQLVDCQGGGIMRFDVETQEAILFAVYGQDAPTMEAGTRLPLEGIVGIEALRRGEILVEQDLLATTDPPPAIQALQATGVRSYVAVPLFVQNDLIGALALGSESPGAFSPESVEIAREVADQLAVALHQADLRVALESEQQKLEALVEHLPEGILLLDGSGRILLANPAACAYLPLLTAVEHPATGWAGEVLTHLVGLPLDEILNSPFEGQWRDLVVSGPPRRFFQAVAPPVRLAADISGWALVVQDVTERRQVQERVHQQERLAAVGQLAGGIAHDFNNLLSAIMLYAQLPLKKPGLPPEAVQSLEIIAGESRRAAELVQQILDFSRRSAIETRPVDLGPFVKEAVRMLERTVPESISLVLAVQPGEYVVQADPTRIQQVLMNLVVNGRDAMPKGGVLRIGLSTLEVELGERPPVAGMEAGQWVCLSVSDTGAGISPEVLPHIFEPFFTTKARGEGSGLGLAQVHGIVTQHGGTYDVQTTVGDGTTFYVYLPAHHAEEDMARDEEIESTPEGKGEIILLVEDNERVREASRKILESLGYRVLTAANGQEALECYAMAEGIDLVLTDVVMPEMGAEELTRTLREMNPDVKVLAISGYVEAEEQQALRAAGILDLIHKPLDVDILAKTIRRVLGAD